MELLTDSTFLIYASIFFGPFIQEDAAVLLAASLSANHEAYFPTMFFVILAGLFLSDVWKYWIGWAALSNDKAKAFAEKKHVASLQEKVQKYTFLTLFVTRFLPLARVPVYIACGFFKVPYWKYCLTIGLTATTYTAIIFTICHWVDEALGKTYLWALPIIAIITIIVFFLIQIFKHRKP